MRNFLATALLLLFSTTALAGDGYTCLMPPPPGLGTQLQPIIPIEYVVYNGTGSSEAKAMAMDTYHRLVGEHSAFFQAYPPELKVFDERDAFLAAFFDAKNHQGWRTAVILGDTDLMHDLHATGIQGVAFVPSEADVGYRAVDDIRSIAGTDYYSIASDHAIRRLTRMAAGLDPAELTVITAEHIITDAMAAR